MEEDVKSYRMSELQWEGRRNGRPTYRAPDGSLVTQTGGGFMTLEKAPPGQQASAPIDQNPNIQPSEPPDYANMTENQLLDKLAELKGQSLDQNHFTQNGGTGFLMPGGSLNTALDVDRSNQVRDIRGQIAKIREAKAITGLENARTQFNTAIQKQLDELLKETGFQADQARMQIGGAASQRGLGRSSFAQQGIGDVSLREMEQKSNQRLQAAESTSRVNRAVEEQRKGIERRREEMELNKDLSEVDKAEDIKFAFDRQKVQQEFEFEIQKMEMDARDKSLFQGLVGDALGSIATIFTGGLG